MASHGSERHDPPTHPSGRGTSDTRLPKHVYHRRRVIAVALVLLALFLVGWGIRALGGGDDAAEQSAAEGPAGVPQATTEPPQKFEDFTPRPAPSGSASGGGSPSATPSSTTAPECGSKLSVSASTDKESYGKSEHPVLTMTIENTGDQPCTVDLGTQRMAFVVTSGSDTVFDSRHCAAGGEERTTTLNAGQKESAKLGWDRVRTAEGCPAGQSEALAGYYNLTVSLGDMTSQKASFVLS